VAEVPRACEANPNVLHCWRREVRQFGPGRSPAAGIDYPWLVYPRFEKQLKLATAHPAG
jgi:hypothetical protein